MFASSTVSQIKCAVGLNVHGERIKFIDKSNMHACCPLCKSKESWEHVVLCEKMKNRRDAWINMMQKKLNKTAKKGKAWTYERKIVNEKIKDVRKYFNGVKGCSIVACIGVRRRLVLQSLDRY